MYIHVLMLFQGSLHPERRDPTSQEKIQTSIENCYYNNVMPIFLNFTRFVLYYTSVEIFSCTNGVTYRLIVAYFRSPAPYPLWIWILLWSNSLPYENVIKLFQRSVVSTQVPPSCSNNVIRDTGNHPPSFKLESYHLLSYIVLPMSKLICLLGFTGARRVDLGFCGWRCAGWLAIAVHKVFFSAWDEPECWRFPGCIEGSMDACWS